MFRLLGSAVLFAAIVVVGPLSGQDDVKKPVKKDAKVIKDGIVGKVESVNEDKGTLTVKLEDGKEKVFSINDKTDILGPRGGVIRSRLGDKRFKDKISVTIVMDEEGKVAKAIYLGIDRKTTDATAKGKKMVAKTGDDSGDGGKAKPVALETIDVVGKIHKVDAAKRILIVTDDDGKEHSFMVAESVKIQVGKTTTKLGLKDEALKVGSKITVTTDSGGKKVQEIKVTADTDKSKTKSN